MAISPREELRIVSVTTFWQDDDGGWDFATRAPDGTEAVRHEGYDTREDAVRGFFAVQEYDPDIVYADPTVAHYSEPIEDEAAGTFDIREYAYGAPNPFPGRHTR